MRKTRRFNGEDGSSVNERGEKRFTATPDSTGKSAEPTKPLPRERIITKEQVEAKGFTNLRDFLNDERKLKRKDAPKAAVPKENQGDVNAEFARKPKGLYSDAAAATSKRESAKDVTEDINKKVKSKGFEDALSYALPIGAAAAAGTAAYKLGGKELLKRAAEKFVKPAEKVAERVEPYIATKAQEAAKKGMATKAKRAAAKKEAEAAADEARMGGEGGGGGFKRGGKIRRFAAGGEVAAKKAPEPAIPKATQESMRRQAEQERIDRRQKKEQDAGEREVRENMGRKFFAKGGKVSSASKRADGCAVRGKTRA